MPEPKQIFEEYYDKLLDKAHDANISLGLSRSVTAYRERKAQVMEKFPHTVELAKEIRRIKEDCVERLGELVQKATATLEENGAIRLERHGIVVRNKQALEEIVRASS